MYIVKTKYYDNGKVEAAPPEWVDDYAPVTGNEYIETKDYDLYRDYFKSEEEAEKHYKQSLSA